MKHKEFTVHDRLGPLTVAGAMLAESRYGSDRKPRWTDLALYRIKETGSDHWLTARCAGCTPPQILITPAADVANAPTICPRCQRPYGRFERPFRYALEIIARSWVYHRIGSTCARNKHMTSIVGDIKERSEGRWKNLLPCTKCNPGDLEELRDDDRIAEERSDPHVYLCPDASSIIRRLYHHSGEISPLAARLLRAAAREDPMIAATLRASRRI